MKKIEYVSNYWDIVRKYVKNKDVLDVGCVAHSIEFSEKDDWLHGLLCENAKSVIGVDILEDEVRMLKEKGYNVICGNAETVKIDRTFDVVVLGDVLEQVSNQGLLLDNMYNYLRKNGHLIITTPNVFGWWNLKDMLFKRDFRLAIEHVCLLHDINSLTHILKRHNFEIESAYYTDSARNILCKYFPVFSDTLVVIAKKAKKDM